MLIIINRAIFLSLFFFTASFIFFPKNAKAHEFVQAKVNYSSYFLAAYLGWDTFAEAKVGIAAATCRADIGRNNCTVIDNGADIYQGYNLDFSRPVIVSYDYADPRFPQDPVSHNKISGGVSVSYTCPTSFKTFSGDSISGFICYRPDPIEIPCACGGSGQNEPTPEVGDPIIVSNFLLHEVETDYTNVTRSLNFVRTYRSDIGAWVNNYQSTAIDWNANSGPDQLAYSCYFDSSDTGRYCWKYVSIPKPYNVEVRRGTRIIQFGTASDYLPPRTDINDRASPALAVDGTAAGWNITNTVRDTVETYGRDGRIQKELNRAGQTTTFQYSDRTTPSEIAPSTGLLIGVTDAFGNILRFTYDQSGRMKKLIDPDNNEILYTYDSIGRLIGVTYPDGKAKSYLYVESGKAINSGAVNYLTGIVDENGSRYASFYYNGPYAISTEQAGGVNKFSLSGYYGDKTVTDPLGAQRVYRFQDLTMPANIRKSTGVTQLSPTGSGYVASSVTYDAQGNVSSKTDFAGLRTTFRYDLSRNLEISRTEAVDTDVSRTITTEWHPQFRLAMKIAEPLKLVVNTYDTLGRLSSRTEQATLDTSGVLGLSAKPVGTARKWAYTYNQFGQLLSSTGPLSDGNDITTLSYDERGNRTAVTNPLGQKISYGDFDGSGRPRKIVLPNGLTTFLTYTTRGWLASSRVTDGAVSELTNYEYDGVGQLIKVTYPDAAILNYTYDPAHRLTNIDDGIGNRIHYILDNAGNRLKEEVTGNGGDLVRQTTRVYNLSGLIKQQTGGAQ
jgi:YD repeat-containing protein